jgi:hypothetical protein
MFLVFCSKYGLNFWLERISLLYHIPIFLIVVFKVMVLYVAYDFVELLEPSPIPLLFYCRDR